MMLIGTIVNVFAVIFGSLIGLFFLEYPIP